MFGKFCALLLVLSFLGCAKEKSDLELTLPGQSVYLIPSSTTSCSMRQKDPNERTNDISSKYFEIRGLAYKWGSQTEDLTLTAVKVTVSGDPLTTPFVASISSEELINTVSSTWDGRINRTASEAPTILQTNCPLIFGGFTLPIEIDKDFDLTGTIQIIGYSTDDEGQTKPQIIQEPFQLTNIGLNN